MFGFVPLAAVKLVAQHLGRHTEQIGTSSRAARAGQCDHVLVVGSEQGVEARAAHRLAHPAPADLAIGAQRDHWPVAESFQRTPAEAGTGVTMSARINKEACIACGVCADIAPEIFTMGEDTAEVMLEDVPPEHYLAVRDAAESGPTEAIVLA